MAPLRRARGAGVATRSTPYSGGRARGVLGLGDDELGKKRLLDSGTTLPDDALAAVFARLSDGAAIVRCAATCRRWGRVVGKEAAVLSRAFPRLGRFALGFFHQENNDGTSARSSAAAEGPCFVPIPTASASASRLFQAGDHGILGCSRPVACRNGRLVLELRREGRADGLRLCVRNPTTGDADMLPGVDWPGYYVCALLTGNDVDPPVFSPAYFRLLLVYNRRGFTALRRYSSDTGRWGPEAKADVRISSGWLRHMGPAAALRGVVYWLLGRCVLGVRLDGSSEVMGQYLLPYGGISKSMPRSYSRYRTMGVSPEGTLCVVSLLLGGKEILAVRTASLRRDVDDIIITRGRLEEEDWSDTFTKLNQLKIRCAAAAAMTCRWFCEKSRVVFFTLGEGSSVRGTFAFDLETKALEKVADRDSWSNFYGYELEPAAYLKALVPA